jgi:hypothetical protein
MRDRASRPLFAALLGLLVASLLGAAGAPVRGPGRLVILSTIDVKGRTSHCGCHDPKGGLARRATFVDSVRAADGRVLIVDAGGFFPDLETHRDVAAFLMDAMREIGVDAVGIGDRELRYGLAFLLEQVRRTRMPVVSANLYDRDESRLVFPPYVIASAGGAKVGFFSVMDQKVSLGPSEDSLSVGDPESAAQRTVAALRKQGAGVVVLLSQLDKAETEALCAAVPGIDAVVTGHGFAEMVHGAKVGAAAVVYGGQQGQHMGRFVVDLGAGGKPTSVSADFRMLSGEIPDHPAMAKRVKQFEDAFNEKMRAAEKALLAEQQAAHEANQDRFLGAEVCMRCHVDEGEQWRTTSHSKAWQTLVDANKDATPDCIPCHVVGFRQPGGFQTGADAERLANVQCENCHGMGAMHDAFPKHPRRVTEQTCVTCHHGENDPEFDFALKLPKIAHGNSSGETIRMKRTGVGAMLKSDGAH